MQKKQAMIQILLLCLFCAAGAAMIGFFADNLDTVWGSMLFALGIALVAFSIITFTKQKRD